MQTKIWNRFIVFQKDTNNVGTLFGGKLMAEMDLTAAMLCQKLLVHSEADGAVTASFSKIDFKAPAHVGDQIEITAELKMVGKTSLRIFLEANKLDQKNGGYIKIGSSSATFVSLKNEKPFPHGLGFNSEEEQ